MAYRLSQPDYITVLIGNADWAWPEAVEKIFRPHGINALVANSSNEMVSVIDKNKIHLAIVDESFDDLSGMHTMKIIRKHDRLLPCIMLATQIDRSFLTEALNLDVFSVVAKPVDMGVLSGQLNRLFWKYYDLRLF